MSPRGFRRTDGTGRRRFATGNCGNPRPPRSTVFAALVLVLAQPTNCPLSVVQLGFDSSARIPAASRPHPGSIPHPASQPHPASRIPAASRPHYAFALHVALSGCRCLMATALSLPACLCHCRCCHGCLPRRFPAHGLAKAERQLGGGGEEKIAAAAATGAATTPVVVAAATAAARRRRRRWRRDDLVFVNTINLTETCLPLRVRVAQPYARDFAAPPGLLHDSDSRARIPLSRRQLLFWSIRSNNR